MSTLDGTTLLIRIGHFIRQGQAYFPPRTIMDEHLKYALLHDGHLLYTNNHNGMSAKTNKDTAHVILYSSQTLLMLVGDVAEFGGPYDPDTWPEGSSYHSPKPWSLMPGRHWVALDNVRTIDDFDPHDYGLLPPLSRPDDPVIPLEETDYATGRRPMSRVTPLQR